MSTDIRSYRVYVEPLAVLLGDGYAAYAPALAGCMADGATPEEALRNVYDAIACWIADAQADGATVPKP